MKHQLLRYSISSWDKLTQCKSNNSPDLHIVVAQIDDEPVFKGKRISVVHSKYGPVYTALVGGSGTLVDSPARRDGILMNLHNLGFLIEWSTKPELSDEQKSLLSALISLGVDKIRCMAVRANGCIISDQIIAFSSEHHPAWMTQSYTADRGELLKAITAGTAINVTTIGSNSNKFNWEWLNFIPNIKDLLE